MEFRKNLNGVRVRIIEDKTGEQALTYYNEKYKVKSVIGWEGTIKENDSVSPWVELDKYKNSHVAFSVLNLEEIPNTDIDAIINNLDILENKYKNI